MKYEYCAPDAKYYATDLRVDVRRGTLQWISGRGQDVLLVRTAYQQNAEELMTEICRELSGIKSDDGKFIELKNHAAVRHVSVMERIRENGCPLAGLARRYTVFACADDGRTRKVYAHRTQTVSSPCCDVPLQLRPEVQTLTRKRGFLRKTDVPTGYYRLIFPLPCDSSFADGDLEYRAGGVAIPVTRRLYEAGEAYVQSPETPVFAARRPGIELI